MTITIYDISLLFFGLLDIFIFFHVLNHKLTYRFSRRTFIIPVSISYIFFIIASYSPFLFPGIPVKILFMLLSLTCMYLSYTDNAFKKLLWIVIPFFALITCELVTLPIILAITGTELSSLNQHPIIQIIATLISRVLLILVTTLLIRSKKKISDFFLKDFFLIIFVNVTYALTIFCFFYIDGIYLSTETAITLSLVVMFLITFLALYLLRKITKKSEEIMTTNLKLQQIEMEHKQNQDMAIVVEDLRSLRHDMNNHMSVLQGLLSMEEYEDAKNYLSTITEELSVANSFVFIDNKVLSVLINNKISKARQLGITLETEFLTTTTPFSDSDLCAVLGNILENAIEASSNHENPYIYFSMSKQDDHLLIQCDNTYTVTPIFEKGHLVTTKADKAYHGIGTKTICSVVEGYHGTTRFTVDELFHVNISVPM